jgi:hypothetical protein
VLHHFPIALHPIHKLLESNDSEQVLTVPTNRRAGRVRHIDFGEAAPFTRRSGTRRKCAPGYSWPPLLYQDLFRIPRAESPTKRRTVRRLTQCATRISMPPSYMSWITQGPAIPGSMAMSPIPSR